MQLFTGVSFRSSFDRFPTRPSCSLPTSSSSTCSAIPLIDRKGALSLLSRLNVGSKKDLASSIMVGQCSVPRGGQRALPFHRHLLGRFLQGTMTLIRTFLNGSTSWKEKKYLFLFADFLLNIQRKWLYLFKNIYFRNCQNKSTKVLVTTEIKCIKLFVQGCHKEEPIM